MPAPPGVRRRLRVAVGGHHHEPVVLPVGRGVLGRPDGRGGDRPDRQPRGLVQFRGESYRVRNAFMWEG